jgi:hypothetical protein
MHGKPTQRCVDRSGFMYCAKIGSFEKRWKNESPTYFQREVFQPIQASLDHLMRCNRLLGAISQIGTLY